MPRHDITGDAQELRADLLQLGRACGVGARMPQPAGSLADRGCQGSAGVADEVERIPQVAQHLQATQILSELEDCMVTICRFE